MLGLPLMVTTSIASGPRVGGPFTSPQFATPELQAAQAERVLPILLAKQVVHGIIWGQLDDRHRPHQPYKAGVFDESCQPKPVLDVLTQLRAEHLA